MGYDQILHLKEYNFIPTQPIRKETTKNEKLEWKFSVDREKIKQAMMTLQGMADHRFTSVSLFTNVFLGEIFFSP